MYQAYMTKPNKHGVREYVYLNEDNMTYSFKKLKGVKYTQTKGFYRLRELINSHQNTYKHMKEFHDKVGDGEPNFKPYIEISSL